MNKALITFEWPDAVEANKITRVPIKLFLEATEAERNLIAKRLGLLALQRLEAEIELVRLSDGIKIKASGQLHADITQACVYTLEPVGAHIETDVEAFYLDEAEIASFAKTAKKKALSQAQAEILDREMPNDEDEPEEIIGGKVYLGELVVQMLSLALPDYPQAAGADDKLQASLQTINTKENAFAKLKSLKDTI